jgi:hypothetical protein
MQLRKRFKDSRAPTLDELNVLIDRCEGNLLLADSSVRRLPENLVVPRSLDVQWSQIRKLPEGLRVGRDLNAKGCKIRKLPADIEVGGELRLFETLVPEIEGLPYSYGSMWQLPTGGREWWLVGTTLYLSREEALAHLPEHLRAVVEATPLLSRV